MSKQNDTLDMETMVRNFAVDAQVRACLEKQSQLMDGEAIVEGVKARLAQEAEPASVLQFPASAPNSTTEDVQATAILSIMSTTRGQIQDRDEHEELEITPTLPFATAILEKSTPNVRFGRRFWLQTSILGGACLLFGLLTMLPSKPKSLADDTLLSELLDAHQETMVRSYQVQVTIEQEIPAIPHLRTQEGTRHIEFGERFYVEWPRKEGSVCWGRDDRGRVWFTASEDVGMRLQGATIPTPLQTLCNVRSLHLEQLLRRLPSDFEVRLEPHAHDDQVRVFQARSRTGYKPLSIDWVRLEVDPETKWVSRVTLQRSLNGKPLGQISFTQLACRALKNHVEFELEGHISADAAIYTWNHPGLRLHAF